jgi:hypothetical protein
MPLQQLQFRAGINREGTTLANEGGWFECNKVRFRSGYPEKIGGWTPLTNQTFTGICRSIWNWVTLKGNNLLGLGTNEKFYIENGSVYYDITPYRLFTNSGSVTNPYRITANSAVVTVVIANHSVVAGDMVTFANSSTVSFIPGTFFDGTFYVDSVVNANAFTITIGATTIPSGTLGTNPITTLTNSSNVTVTAIAHGMIANNSVSLANVTGNSGTLGTNPFATTSGSRIVTVTSTAHGLSNTFTVSFTGSTAVGGIPAVDFNTTHTISNATANTYTIITSNAASSTTTGGGAAVAFTYPYIGGVPISQLNTIHTIQSITNANAYVITVAATATANVSGGGSNVSFVYSNIAGGGNVTYDLYEFQQRLIDPFSTINGSSTVTVTDTNHGASDGSYVTFADATPVAGLTINGEYKITYIDSNTYTIDAGSNANATTTGGGTVIAEYQINIGFPIYTTTVGWGSGTWGGFSFNATVDYLDGGINAAVTTVTVDDTAGFPATGLILIDNELITYTGITTTTFTGCTRGAEGTIAASHSNNATVYAAGDFNGWGEDASNAQGAQLRLWSQATYGEYLMFNPRNEGIYMWVPTYNASNQLIVGGTYGELLSPYNTGIYQTENTCPVVSTLVMVSDSSRFLISFGCNDYGSTVQNPMLVRWSDQEDYRVWTPAVTNQAGSFQLSSGSYIVTAVQTRQEILVFTDAGVWSMKYLGPPYVWGFDIMSHNISIAGPNVVAAANNIVYWMGIDKFYVYSGRVETLPSSLRQYVFNDINMEQSFQFFAGTNEGFSEIWWFYCSANSTAIDRYVIYNYLDKVWYYGTLARSAWLDSPLRRYPMGASYADTIVYHENGADDVESTGQVLPIEAYVQSSDFDIGDGHNFGFVWRIIPDLTFDGSTTPDPNKPEVTFTVRPRQNPGSAYGTSATPTVESAQSYANQKNYTVQEFTEIVYTRVRGRQMAFRVSSNTIGTQWQLGVPRIDVRPDGRR